MRAYNMEYRGMISQFRERRICLNDERVAGTPRFSLPVVRVNVISVNVQPKDCSLKEAISALDELFIPTDHYTL